VKLRILLFQNYPNPFNPSTTIKYSIPNVETRRGVSPLVTLKIYDILGREVVSLVDQKQNPGNYEVVFNASHLSSGTYFYRLVSGTSTGSVTDFSKTMKLLLVK